MNYINLTDKTIIVKTDRMSWNIPPSGIVAKTAHSAYKVENDPEGIPHRVIYPDMVYGIPDPSRGLMFIVDSMVAMICHRDDVCAPDIEEALEDESEGEITVGGFVRYEGR